MVAVISDRVAATTGADSRSPATWIAPYVDPHKMYTLAKAIRTRVDLGMLENMVFLCYGMRVAATTLPRADTIAASS
jgi:hypothetical protein